MKYVNFVSNDPMDFVRVALAIETIVYHDKTYLNKSLQNNNQISEEIQKLLTKAIELSDKVKEID